MSHRKVIRSPRLERKARKRAAHRTLALSVFSLVAVGALCYALFRPEFRIREITINGARSVPEALVKSTVQSQISGRYFGVLPKSHSLFFPRDALKAAVLSAFPTVSDVSLSLGGIESLRVRLEERTPQALWCTVYDTCFLVDETGFVFAEASDEERLRYYRIEDDGTVAAVGSTAIEGERLRTILDFLAVLEKEFSFSLARVLLQENGDITVVLRNGVRLLASEGEFEGALSGLRILLATPDALPHDGGVLMVAYIDLRYGNKIYFKPAGE